MAGQKLTMAVFGRRVWVWLRKALHMLMPPLDHDWPLVTFQPVFYTFMWCAAIFLWAFGDIESAHGTGELSPVWFVLMLLCPPIALTASLLIHTSESDPAGGHRRYFGKHLRLGADSGMLFALVAYTIRRFALGDFHVIPVFCLLACTTFTALLVLRDIHNLGINDRLAAKLTRTGQIPPRTGSDADRR